MEQKEITVKGKVYVVKELKYKDMTKLAGTPQEEITEKLLMKSTGLTQEEFDELSISAGIQIQKIFNELNSIEDFQTPPKE